MELVFIGIIFGCVGGLFLSLKGPEIVRNTVMTKYKSFRKLNKLVSSRSRGCCIIFWISIQLLVKALWFNFLQFINNSVKKVDKHRYEVSYVINGRLYKMIVRNIRGPCPVLLIVDDNNEDVTDVIVPYMGAGRDFHKFKFTPQFFGHTHLSVELSSGETKTFGETEVINFIE
jgi:hypothetical protein